MALTQLLAVQVAAALTAVTVMLAVAFIIVTVLVVKPGILPKDQNMKLNLNHLE